MKLLTTFCLLGISCSVFAQGTQTMGTANNNLDIANINATIQTGGDFFTKNPGGAHNLNNPNVGFEVPKGSGRHTIFAGGLWLGGKDASGQIYTASQTYRQNLPSLPQVNFWPGPIGTTQGAAHNTKYDRIWKVTKAQIQNHILLYNKPFYKVPADIATWPGNGSAANGEAAQLAPYVDVNNDGIYSPNLGDYPKIKGDQALYLILNDKGNVKVPASPTMNAEVHVMYYGFNTPGNSPIYNTVFSEQRIINRGSVNFNNFYAGIWVDFDLGAWYDDFVGCDTTTNRFYAYNGDNFDEDTMNLVSPFGSQQVIGKGYGANPPVQSVIFLDQDMGHFLYYNNDSNIRNGNPTRSSNFYNYLSGLWRDNTPVTYGKDGTDQASTPFPFMFPGKNGNYWCETNIDGTNNTNIPSDRRGVGSIGPFNLNAGQELKFTVAYTFSQGTSASNSLNLAEQDAIAVHNFFRNAVVTGTKPDKVKQPLQLFPNPATDQLTIQLPAIFENKKSVVVITDNLGRKVLETPVARNSGSKLQLNIATLSKGMYQVTLTSGEETITAKLAKL